MKSLVLILGLTCACSFAKAQSFYLKLGGGYSFPLASSSLGKNHLDRYLQETNPETGYYEPSMQITEEEVAGTYNTGMLSSATLGYRLSENMGIEVTAGYVFGRTYELHSNTREQQDEVIGYESTQTTSWKSSNTFVAPSFVLTAGTGSVRPYLAAGPAFALGTIDEKFSEFSDFSMNPVPTQRNERYSRGIAVGARGTGGVDFMLGEKLSLFCEITFLGMSYYPKEKETVKYNVDGEDLLEVLTTREKEVRFVSKMHYDSRTDASPTDQPREELRRAFGMSSLSATAGLKIPL